jgi:hypothetical protein
MATLDATQIPSSTPQQLNSSSIDDWDVDGAEEIATQGGQQAAIAGENGTGQGEASAQPKLFAPDLSEWDVDIPDPVGAVAPVVETIENESSEPASEELPQSEENPEAILQDDPSNVDETGDPEDDEESEDDEDENDDADDSASENDPEPATSDDVLGEVMAASRELERASAVVEALKHRMKEANEDLKAAINRMRRFASEISADADRPLIQKARTLQTKNVQPVEEPPFEVSSDSVNDQTAVSESPATVEIVRIPTRLRITVFDPAFPALELNSEHDILSVEANGEFTIQNPREMDKQGSQYLIEPKDCEVIAWEESEVATVSQAESAALDSGTQDSDESWRSASLLNDLGLPPGLCELLSENPEKTIKTVGDITDWTSKGKNLTDIPKIGQSKADKIQDALEKFWERRQREASKR